MTNEDRINLITRNCEEIIIPEDLEKLVESGRPIKHYIGFEISGLVHLGTGLMAMGKIADFVQAGVDCTILLADYHSFLNNKLGGDLAEIRWAAENYFKEALIASLKCFNIEAGQINWLTEKDFYKENPEIWEKLMRVSQHITLSRNLRSISIMGKAKGKEVDMATLIYPPLQVADIFTLDIDLAHAGMDQRKAHVVARDVAKKLKWKPPIAIHHNLVAGLKAATSDLKMSKSKPESAIFIHDSPEEIRAKIKKAYCPPAIIDNNPMINWLKTLMFWGEETAEYKQLIKDYQSGRLHPLDLKEKIGDWLIKKLAPARAHFEIEKNKQSLARMKSDCFPKNL